MKRKKEGEYENTQNRTVKQTLNTILRPKFRKSFRILVFTWCLAATRISTLASLLLLYYANKAIDQDECDENTDFFDGNGKEVIYNYFHDVLYGNHQNLPFEFLSIVRRACPRFIWPHRHGIGNAFNAIVDQYIKNVQTNLNTWCKSHIKKFFTMKQYELNRMLRIHSTDEQLITDKDVNHAVSAVVHQYYARTTGIRTHNMYILIAEAEKIGVPVNQKLKKYVEENWFASLRFFLKIQRAIDEFHRNNNYLCSLWEKYRNNRNLPKPSEPAPPKIGNFNAIPICDNQLKHISIDHTQFYFMACKIGALKRRKGKHGKINISYAEYKENPFSCWNYVFDMYKIKKLGKGKEFEFLALTDNVAVSLVYIEPIKPESIGLSWERIRHMFEVLKCFVYEIGIDPGFRTWNATVRRHIETDTEENITVDAREYHWLARYNQREKKGKRYRKEFQEEERAHMESFIFMPSPKGKFVWKFYIETRVAMMDKALAVYSQRKYVRLKFDHYSDSVHASDETAKMLTNGKPTMAYIGASGSAANSPIGIKKRQRCPGTRKLVASFKKLGNVVIKFIDEWNTSQHCAKCINRFDPRTKSHRSKVCHNCLQTGYQVRDGVMILPKVIITKMSKRQMQRLRKRKRLEQAAQPNNVVQPIVAYPNPPQPRLVPKIVVLFKMELNDAGEWVYVAMQTKTVWDRDIVAAKCIMYKGHCEVFGEEIHPSLKRPRPPPHVQLPDEPADEDDNWYDEWFYENYDEWYNVADNGEGIWEEDQFGNIIVHVLDN
ncbi:uncharacterized protein LOC116336903 [Contarinia nasturtii]|uniref:uncharacterized protein LOC116336903 n=1 Tax=Contarinia nasturtii TaxID=265458 RepID=UPI0012D4A31B|nr:uncharacterized protein LOC116336903 [Contarinia nasturtii]